MILIYYILFFCILSIIILYIYILYYIFFSISYHHIISYHAPCALKEIRDALNVTLIITLQPEDGTPTEVGTLHVLNLEKHIPKQLCPTVTLWLFNIAMEHGPFTDGLPLFPY